MSTFFMGISNCSEIPCAASSPRSTVNWPMAQRGVVGAVPQNRRELNHGETGKGDPFWGWKPVVGVWPDHGGFDAISW